MIEKFLFVICIVILIISFGGCSRINTQYVHIPTEVNCNLKPIQRPPNLNLDNNISRYMVDLVKYVEYLEFRDRICNKY